MGGKIQGQITRKGAHSQDVGGELSRTRSPAQLLVEVLSGRPWRASVALPKPDIVDGPF